ncbi:MAG TPA: hypothetical protein VH115_10810 [Solirubrobacteraceae bacterium]|nr:hypothetical protein [Solirubrobacteraceae bacterium]
MTARSRAPRAASRRALPGRAARTLLAAALGVAAALLVSCSSSGGGLIPSANAGPLREDFEAVVRAAERGNGNCSETESALAKTEVDFSGLPASVSSELRSTLRRGIDNLKLRARALCSQPLPQSTNTTSTQTTPTTTTTPTTPTTTTSTQTTPTQTTPTTTNPGGGTPAEESKGGPERGAGGEEPPGKSDGKGSGGLEVGK